MDVKDYCETVGKELAAWKTKMNKVYQKADALAGVDRKKAEPQQPGFPDYCALNSIKKEDIILCADYWGYTVKQISGKIL